MKSRNKDFNAIFHTLQEQGWEVGIARSGHMRLVSPSGQKVFASASPSDRRAKLNLISDLRHKGALI